ncbi:uncharacterized protein DUF2530 [Allonocardiopsis opalescens]|uniref:Uncharacterized protein DUF2530 n=2 Tax=Allonocardiopsis opalescens TaxID=1144618 RepID=A0A2T0QA13_9ACTN|nr:uncharacterized protein DUF2530 [Allonocardiopsis opalescens]
MQTDDRLPAVLGSLAWAAALVVLLLRGDSLAEQDRWWIWVCVTGLALGLFAILYIPRLHRKRAEAEERGRARRARREAERRRAGQALDGAAPDPAGGPVPGTAPDGERARRSASG